MKTNYTYLGIFTETAVLRFQKTDIFLLFLQVLKISLIKLLIMCD